MCFKTNKETISILAIIFLIIFSNGCLQNSNEPPSDQQTYFVVDMSFTSNTDGFQTTRFNTIQSAINEATENTTIFVHNGIYKETITIPVSVTLYGENANNTIIDGNNEMTIITLSNTGNCTIHDFTIRNTLNGTTTVNPQAAGIDIRTNNNTIYNIIFTNDTTGIYLRHTANNTIYHNVFKSNAAYGIYLHSLANNNNIHNNIFINNTYGIRVKASTTNSIYHNLFKQNSHAVYLCCGSVENVLYENSFIENSIAGIDEVYNQWDNGKKGNYWDQYHLESHGAFDQNEDGIIDTAYSIPGGSNSDRYPLTTQPMIKNPFNEKINTS